MSIWHMNVQKARSPSASRPWPPPAAARPGLMAPRSASMALQASAPGKLRGALGRLGYLRSVPEAQRQCLSARRAEGFRRWPARCRPPDRHRLPLRSERRPEPVSLTPPRLSWRRPSALRSRVTTNICRHAACSHAPWYQLVSRVAISQRESVNALRAPLRTCTP